jgi:hypothetical protein
MGRIRLHAGAAQRSYDAALGRFTDDEAVPCYRCGVCCERWQPLVGPAEAARLAAQLDLALPDFLARYARPYPFAEETYQLRERPEGGCVFLTNDYAGRSGCAVHEARPQACRDWDASLLRRECRDGLQRLPADGFAAVTLYDDPDDLRLLVERLRGPLPMGGRGG